jgi:site-specific DNA-methyltransferase (adenine-specific)
MAVVHGDCIEVMATLDAESIDAIVTDPPYGLGFMGKAWDSTGVAFDPETWAAALRVAKPGAHLLAFGGTRTYHRLACAIEDAGWIIRDMLVWAYASGFPKSLDVSKAIDKSNGHWRGRAGAVTVAEQPAKGTEYERTDKGEPITAAAAWDGWGTALKPAWEPIVLARKPLRGTVAANVRAFGTGALNIDGTRIGPDGGGTTCANRDVDGNCRGHDNAGRSTTGATVHGPDTTVGRWPANVLLTDPIFDGDVPGVVGGGGTRSGVPPRGADDSGTYSRFFLIPKAARSDREPVLRSDRERLRSDRELPFDDMNRRLGNTLAARRENSHPTVKPVELMRHLVRLVTPPSGLVLDPFLGSGTTAVACEMEGFRWLGIEREAEYVAIAEARLNGIPRGMGL